MKKLLFFLIFTLSSILIFRHFDEQKISITPIKEEPLVLKNRINENTYIINFFSTWCSLCVSEHDLLMKLKELSPYPIFGVSVMDKNSNIKEFLDDYGNPYKSIFLDFIENELISLDVKSLPKMIIVHNGNIVSIFDKPLSPKLLQNVVIPTINSLIEDDSSNKNLN